jgi:hypothetical protein
MNKRDELRQRIDQVQRETQRLREIVESRIPDFVPLQPVPAALSEAIPRYLESSLGLIELLEELSKADTGTGAGAVS